LGEDGQLVVPQPAAVQEDVRPRDRADDEQQDQYADEHEVAFDGVAQLPLAAGPGRADRGCRPDRVGFGNFTHETSVPSSSDPAITRSRTVSSSSSVA